MYLKDVNLALDHRISDGSEYCWQCYPDSRFLHYESDHAYATVIFNTKTQEIYEAEVNDKLNKYRPYRWLNPLYKDSYITECKEKNVDHNMAWDDVKWVDLETSDDWLEKAKALMDNLPFDERVDVPLNLDDDVLMKLCLEAHKRDITLNQMVEIILQKVVDEHQSTKT